MIASTLSAIVIITLASGLVLALVQARRWRAGGRRMSIWSRA